MNFGFRFGLLKTLIGLFPPISDAILVWLKGNDDGADQKLDSHVEPYAENWTLSQSACASLNGTDEFGTTSTDHGTIESSEGTATVAYDGTTLSFSTAGTFYSVTFSDGKHYRISENSGLVSFDDTGLHTITWTADAGTLWAQKQDTYHGNALYGWWEITGDPVMYPYPVAGFDIHHKAGTFNDCESKLAPEAFPVGSPNGVDHEITMIADHGTIVSHGSLDTSRPTYVHPTITFTAGIVRDILFSDGTFMQLREGEGSGVHDSEDNVIGAILGDSVAFWAGAHMVSQEIIDMEADSTSGNFFTDGLGHPLPMTQAGWDELGAELVENGQFIYGTIGYGTINSTLSVDDGKLLVTATDEFGSATQQIPTEAGKSYQVSLVYYRGNIDGYIEVRNADGGTSLYSDNGSGYTSDRTVTAIFTAIDSSSTVRVMNYVGGAGDYNLWDNISVREVNQVINNNKQYYFTSCDELKRQLVLYKTPRTDTEDADIKVFSCL